MHELRAAGRCNRRQRYMDLCRPRPGRNELGQEWKNNLNYVAVQIGLPLLSQHKSMHGSRSTTSPCTSAHDPGDQADVYLEDRPGTQKGYAARLALRLKFFTTEVEDTSMAKRPTENARCNLGCRDPTLARAASQTTS